MENRIIVSADAGSEWKSAVRCAIGARKATESASVGLHVRWNPLVYGPPEIFCLWASTLTAFDGNNLKHLRRRIRWGNWASRGTLIEQWHCRH